MRPVADHKSDRESLMSGLLDAIIEKLAEATQHSRDNFYFELENWYAVNSLINDYFEFLWQKTIDETFDHWDTSLDDWKWLELMKTFVLIDLRIHRDNTPDRL